MKNPKISQMNITTNNHLIMKAQSHESQHRKQSYVKVCNFVLILKIYFD